MLFLTNMQANRLPVFEDIFNEAIQELNQWGGIIIGEDSE
jgi:hypothetical protein